MLPSIIDELKTRQAYGNLMAEQMCERLDAHIRDLELSKAWIRHNAKAEHDAIDRLLGIAPAHESEAPNAEPPADTFQTDPYEVDENTSDAPMPPDGPRDDGASAARPMAIDLRF